jgi:hypothetical protein
LIDGWFLFVEDCTGVRLKNCRTPVFFAAAHRFGNGSIASFRPASAVRACPDSLGTQNAMLQISPNTETPPSIGPVAGQDSQARSIAEEVRRRRRIRTARFIAFETVAIAVFVISVLAGITERFAAETLTPLFRTLPITAAVVATILPILFFGDPKRKRPFR